MNRFIHLFVFLICIAIMITSCNTEADTPSPYSVPECLIYGDAAIAPIGEVFEETRGVWIASVYNINFPSAPDLTEDKLKSEIDTIIKTVTAYGMNTIYFQVHPASDALYRSEIFPVSEFLFTDGVLRFDPLEYMSKKCQEAGMSLFAWVNPLRVSVYSAGSADEAVSSIPENSPARDSDLTTFYGDGKLYLNCGKSSVRELVCDAVEELARNYNIDGIVFDDYFYPYPVYDDAGMLCSFDDEADFKAADTSLSLEDWRRENVNMLVKSCYDRIKNINPEISFGVAPFGIWQNDNGTGVGSATSGMEAYSELYCDATAWIDGGYVDFISPQLYWECSSTVAPFDELMGFWNDAASGTEVDLIVSHGLFRYDNDWTDPKGELVQQITIAREYSSYMGSMLYGYESLESNIEGAGDDTALSFDKDIYYYNPSRIKDGIEIDLDSGTKIDGSYIIFTGYSDERYPLTVNTKTVKRTRGGYFECELLLQPGKNDFVFTCGDYSKTVVVVKN